MKKSAGIALVLLIVAGLVLAGCPGGGSWGRGGHAPAYGGHRY